jgi:hypothetical protein
MLHHRNECVYECLSTSGRDSRPATQVRPRLRAVGFWCKTAYRMANHTAIVQYSTVLPPPCSSGLPGLPALGRGGCCNAPHLSLAPGRTSSRRRAAVDFRRSSVFEISPGPLRPTRGCPAIPDDREHTATMRNQKESSRSVWKTNPLCVTNGGTPKDCFRRVN